MSLGFLADGKVKNPPLLPASFQSVAHLVKTPLCQHLVPDILFISEVPQLFFNRNTIIM